MPGAVVTMAHYTGVGLPSLGWPTVSTDAAGNYRIGITAVPLANGFVARAQEPPTATRRYLAEPQGWWLDESSSTSA